MEIAHGQNLKTYARMLREALDKLPWDALEKTARVLWKCCQEKKTIYTMGNGGHCTTASHMVNDLAKHTVSADDKKAVVARNRFRAFCLNDGISFLTAVANDMSYEQVFAEQVINVIEPGDVLIGISGSGNSKNILNAFEEAKKRGATTICFSGFNGGKALQVADLNVVAPSHKMVQVEDLHLIFNHMIADELKRLVQGRQEITG